MTISEINSVCSEVYGAGILAISPLVALWLADKILADRGVNVFRKLSAHRNKMGLGTSFPEFGSDLFRTM